MNIHKLCNAIAKKHNGALDNEAKQAWEKLGFRRAAQPSNQDGPTQIKIKVKGAHFTIENFYFSFGHKKGD